MHWNCKNDNWPLSLFCSFVGLVSKSKAEVQETNEDEFLVKNTDTMSALLYTNCRCLDQLCILALFVSIECETKYSLTV